ncbi:MAG: hypothetical protein J7K00_04800 [Candidatus Diapherotrites archaeon]|nr:hypothetical protein [Candidatus Diapherotrites archaeon]
MKYLPVLLLFLAVIFFVLDKRTGQAIGFVLALIAFLVVLSEIKSAPKSYSDDAEEDEEEHSGSKPYPRSTFKPVPTTVKAWKRARKTTNKILDSNKEEPPEDDEPPQRGR